MSTQGSTGRMERLDRRAWLSGMATAFCFGQTFKASAAEPVAPDAKRAFGYLEAICQLGPRVSGTEAMAQQQQLVAKHFTTLGARASFQEFDTPHPVHGQPVRIRNLIVEWHPRAVERVLLCCHYDTRPRPDEELLPSNRNGLFLGANDGASGVATLMELGHFMANLPLSVGVDFVFFDAEELIYQKPGKFFIGSEYFATQYRDQPPAHRYQSGVLLDMVADAKPQFYYEGNSYRLAPDVTKSVWAAAKAEGVKEFFPKIKHTVTDDHLALNQIAKIPTCDVIDFDYPYWHKRNDLPAACSGETMVKVARVMLRWLQGQRAVR